MNGKKIKRINVRISFKYYQMLNNQYISNKKRYNNFSDYIRHLLDLGFENYH